jgi:hypothetical protein
MHYLVEKKSGILVTAVFIILYTKFVHNLKFSIIAGSSDNSKMTADLKSALNFDYSSIISLNIYHYINNLDLVNFFFRQKRLKNG